MTNPPAVFIAILNRSHMLFSYYFKINWTVLNSGNTLNTNRYRQGSRKPRLSLNLYLETHMLPVRFGA